MAKIKTREVVKGTIKTLDKASVAGERMKQAYINTKEKAEQSTQAIESSAEEYAANKMEVGSESAIFEGINEFDKSGRKSVSTTKENYQSAKIGIQKFKEKRAMNSLKKQKEMNNSVSGIKTLEKSNDLIKESARSSGKQGIKTLEKGSSIATKRTIKTAEYTAKTSIKTTKQATKVAAETAKATKRVTVVAKQAAQKTAQGIKVAVRATISAIKAIIAGTKALISAIVAGGWIAVTVIVVLCLVGLLAGSVYGIFYSGEDSGNGMSMPAVVREINTEYDNKLEETIASFPHDDLEVSGGKAVWKEVLAVYAVKTNTDPDSPQEVATMDDNKKAILKSIFWEMNEISHRTETKSETVIEETDDGHGNIVQTEKTVTKTFLYITVSHKSADEIAYKYGFNEKQRSFLRDLLKEENNSLWSAVLYGVGASDDQIVTVALSQIGNVGGQPYWSWYGFGGRVEWCACFVSWCANECGYIDMGVIPKFAGCINGSQWFKDRGQWADKSHEPEPGTIIFFDWEQDGITDHVGIVEKCENGVVYTVEGNSGDMCRARQYSVGSSVIYGYGIPAY